MPVNASTLRKNIYRLLDRVLETGEPLEIETKRFHRMRGDGPPPKSAKRGYRLVAPARLPAGGVVAAARRPDPAAGPAQGAKVR